MKSTTSCGVGGDSGKTRRRRNKNNKKRVRFARKIQYRTTISREDITEEEKQNAWLQEDEKSSIKQRYHSLVERVNELGLREKLGIVFH